MKNQENPTDSVARIGGDLPPERMAHNQLLQQQFQDVAAIGAQVRAAGVLHVARGIAVINQQRLNTLMQELTVPILKLGRKRRKNTADYAAMAKLSDSLGRLSGQLTQSQHLLLDAEKSASTKRQEEPKKPLVQAFLPGERIIPVQPKDSTSST